MSRRKISKLPLVECQLEVSEAGIGEGQGAAIASICDELKEFLLRKNSQYGNSAFEPIRMFSDADAISQIEVRIDDKLSRLRNLGARSATSEDTILDLMGYLVLYRIALGRTGE